MIQLCNQSQKSIKYNPTFVRGAIADRGGLEAARWFINIPNQTTGITKLWENHRLDLSVEALILQPKFEQLFTKEERAIARKTLLELDYAAPWDQGK